MTAHAFALALGVQVLLIAQRQVHDAAFARRHGREFVGDARLAHSLRSDGGRHAQLLQPHGAVIHAIEANFLVLIARQAKHFKRQQFDRAQQFAAAFQQERRIGTGELHQNFRTLPIAVLGNRRIHGDAIFQAQPALEDDCASGIHQSFLRRRFCREWASASSQLSAISYQPDLLKADS